MQNHGGHVDALPTTHSKGSVDWLLSYLVDSPVVSVYTKTSRLMSNRNEMQ